MHLSNFLLVCTNFNNVIFKHFTIVTHKRPIYQVLKSFYRFLSADHSQHPFVMQKMRQKMEVKNRINPSHVSLQIVGSGGPGSSKALYVSTTNSCYLFNCGEGMQRLAFEFHHRLIKLTQIFVTTPVWSNLGGLPGLVLTLENCGISKIVLHGPEGISDLVQVLKKFIVLKNMTVEQPTLSENLIFKDHAMAVQYVPLQGTCNDENIKVEDGEVTVDDTDYYSYEFKKNGKRGLHSKEECRKINKVDIDITKGRISTSVAYICKLHAKAGTLSLEKCVEMGVPPGPLLGQLKSGNDITLPDGTFVKSTDVCSPPYPGPVFIVIDCYNESFLDSLLSNKSFEKHFAENCTNVEDIPYCIIHFTPESILHNTRYRAWMQKFGTKTQHVIVNEGNACLSSEGIHRMQHQLHLIHPTIFPFLNETNWINEENAKNTSNQDESDKSLIIHRAKNGHEIHLRPLKGLDISREVELHPKDYIDEVFKVDGFLDSLAELQTTLNAKTKSLDTTEEYPKVVMLGTGSSIPSKTRNTSSILLQINENTSLLFDCGEGTVGQMFRFFGKSEASRVLMTLKAVYVSHLHADHHIGLIGLLKERERLTQDPVFLLAPRQMGAWLRLYHTRFESVLSTCTLVHNDNLFFGKHVLIKEMKDILFKTLDVSDISTVYVRHCPYAFGVAVTLNNKQKIVYSGDTMPCDNLVKLGYNCHLLIHEATHEDALIAEAREKRHSTVSQALQAGQNMKAKYILLTHFSQRYAKLPRIPDADLDLTNVGFAYDNMQIRFSELPLLSLFYPTLRVMFNEFFEELEKRANKRELSKLHIKKCIEEKQLGEKIEIVT